MPGDVPQRGLLGRRDACTTELVVEGLSDRDARALLAIQGPLDERVRDRIVADARGNPLALLELPRAMTPAELAGGFGRPDPPGLAGRIQESFRRRLDPLPAPTRCLLLIAAAEPVGAPVLVWRAAERLGIAGRRDAGDRGQALRARRARAVPASSGALGGLPGRVARGTAHRPSCARRGHRSPCLAPRERRSRPRRGCRVRVERSADRAQARGGLAAAAFLERSAALSVDPARRAARALAAAQATHQAGLPDAALGLLATAETGPLDELQRARVTSCAVRSPSP